MFVPAFGSDVSSRLPRGVTTGVSAFERADERVDGFEAVVPSGEDMLRSEGARKNAAPSTVSDPRGAKACTSKPGLRSRTDTRSGRPPVVESVDDVLHPGADGDSGEVQPMLVTET